MDVVKKGWADIPLEKLIPADWNYKEDDVLKSEKLVNNLKRNGQVETIIVRQLATGFFEVVNGNHRLAAFPAAEIKTVHVFNAGIITDAHARRLAIETNETRFDSNAAKLAGLMKELEGEFTQDELASTMPYSGEEIEKMQKIFDFEWNNFDPNNSVENLEIKIFVTPDRLAEVKEVINSILAPFEKWCKIKG